MSSTKPLELIYTDVWGLALVLGFEQSQYYIYIYIYIFVDHFTKYTWLYLLKAKSDVPTIFICLKKLVEIFFQTKITTLYIDGGTDYTGVHTTTSTLEFSL